MRSKEEEVWWVYVVGPSELGPVKVGYTKNMRSRMASLQNGAWEPLNIYRAFASADKNRAYYVEQWAHTKLVELGARRVGEWFHTSAEQAIGVIGGILENEWQKGLKP